jgi:hypothetical protein
MFRIPESQAPAVHLMKNLKGGFDGGVPVFGVLPALCEVIHQNLKMLILAVCRLELLS